LEPKPMGTPTFISPACGPEPVNNTFVREPWHEGGINHVTTGNLLSPPIR
jgi:hypothetical protein